MDYDLTRRMRLLTHTGTSLYSWAISEVTEDGDVVGSGQIPWAWDLYFHAKSLVMGDSIVVTRHQPEGQPESTEVKQVQVIRVKLHPGDPRGDGLFRPTQFSMFGTDRIIEDFQIEIRPLSDPAEQESCTVWGAPSYTYESDFRHSTTKDCVNFYLAVRPETFARYAAKITMGGIDELVFRVGSVRGFYAEWSPSISTRKVKVLTAGQEQKVELPEGIEFELPRLSTVHEADLYLNRKLEFGTKPIDETKDDNEDLGTVRVVPQVQGQPVPDQLIKAVTSTGRWIAGLLVLVVLILALKG